MSSVKWRPFCVGLNVLTNMYFIWRLHSNPGPLKQAPEYSEILQNSTDLCKNVYTQEIAIRFEMTDSLI